MEFLKEFDWDWRDFVVATDPRVLNILYLRTAAVDRSNLVISRSSFSVMSAVSTMSTLDQPSRSSAKSLEIPSFRANESRLVKAIHESCQYGAAHPYGK